MYTNGQLWLPQEHVISVAKKWVLPLFFKRVAILNTASKLRQITKWLLLVQMFVGQLCYSLKSVQIFLAISICLSR